MLGPGQSVGDTRTPDRLTTQPEPRHHTYSSHRASCACTTHIIAHVLRMCPTCTVQTFCTYVPQVRPGGAIPGPAAGTQEPGAERTARGAFFGHCLSSSPSRSPPPLLHTRAFFCLLRTHTRKRSRETENTRKRSGDVATQIMKSITRPPCYQHTAQVERTAQAMGRAWHELRHLMHRYAQVPCYAQPRDN